MRLAAHVCTLRSTLQGFLANVSFGSPLDSFNLSLRVQKKKGGSYGGCQSFHLQVVSPTSLFAYIEVISPTRLKLFRLHNPRQFAYIKVVSPTLYRSQIF